MLESGELGDDLQLVHCSNGPLAIDAVMYGLL